MDKKNKDKLNAMSKKGVEKPFAKVKRLRGDRAIFEHKYSTRQNVDQSTPSTSRRNIKCKSPTSASIDQTDDSDDSVSSSGKTFFHSSGGQFF